MRVEMVTSKRKWLRGVTFRLPVLPGLLPARREMLPGGASPDRGEQR